MNNIQKIVLGIIVFFILLAIWQILSMYTEPPKRLGDGTALANGCQKWKLLSPNCTLPYDQITIPNYNPMGKSELKNNGDTLKTACQRIGYVTEDACRTYCECHA